MMLTCAEESEGRVSEKQKMLDILDVTNPEHAELYLPMFGESPGGTPSVSSVSTLMDSRSDLDDMSDVSRCLHISLELLYM